MLITIKDRVILFIKETLLGAMAATVVMGLVYYFGK